MSIERRTLFYFSAISLVSVIVQIYIASFGHISGIIYKTEANNLLSLALSSPPLVQAFTGFLALFLLVHLFFYIIIYVIYKFFNRACSNIFSSPVYLLLYHVIVLISLLSWNRNLYPASIFSWATTPIFEQDGFFYKQLFLNGILGIILAASLYQMIQYVGNRKRLVKYLIISSFPFALALYHFGDTWADSPQNNPTRLTAASKPDVILIGIDSLRPDLIDPILTPTLYEFKESALSFSKAYTPIARTYPSWASILTGKYPINHGVRFNLAPSSQIQNRDTLAWDLRSMDYVTAYATDEKRFANIDGSWGFEIEKGPRIGVTDFVIGPVSDFPLLNLLRKTRLGATLLPDSYNNRAVETLYEPDNFDSDIQALIAELPNKPLFLASHFCLPHWPYRWASSGSYSFGGEISAKTDNQYLKAIHRADAQASQLLSSLEKAGRLNNAIVIVLSDHGESFSSDVKQEIYVPDEGIQTYQGIWGHGTNLIQPNQNHVVLMMKYYGRTQIPVGEVRSPVSLIDIRPTVLGLLDASTAQPMDGTPLPLTANEGIANDRPLYFETGIKLWKMKPTEIDKDQIASKYINYYTINRKLGRLELKQQVYQNLVEKKDLAILKNGWLGALVAISGPERETTFQAVLAKPYDTPLLTSNNSHRLDSLIQELAAFNKWESVPGTQPHSD